MRIHIRPQATVLTMCLALAAAVAFAADPPAVPPVHAAPAAPPAPPPTSPTAPADSAVAPSTQDGSEAAMQAQMDAARRSEDTARRRQEAALRAQLRAVHGSEEKARQRDVALRAQMDAARRRMEMDAQQLAALSAQMYGPMMQRFGPFGRPPRALIGLQLDDSSGDTGARVREVSPGGPAQQAGVRSGDLIVAVNGTSVQGHEPAGRVVELLHNIKASDKVDLKVLRDGKTRDFTLTAHPDGDAFFIARQFPDLPPLPRVRALAAWGGAPMIIRGPVADMELARLTPGLGRYFGTDAGVLVVRAPPDGGLGLQDGDVILSIAGRKPIDSSHVIRILGSYDPGEKVTFEVMRLHRKMSLVATLPPESPFSGPMFEMPKGAVPGPGPVIRLQGDGTF